jgi:dihydroxyacetone kinase
MLTKENVEEINRLSSMLATARVRRALMEKGHGGHGETSYKCFERVRKAEQRLRKYLQSLTKEGHDENTKTNLHFSIGSIPSPI